MKPQNQLSKLDGYEVRSFYSSDDEAFVAIIDALPGCYVDAPTREEALASLRAEKAEWVRLMKERGHQIPVPALKPAAVVV